MGELPAFELFEHTADTGMRVRGQDLKELFANAALGMISIMADPRAVNQTNSLPVDIEGEDLPGLLVAWLNEIIYLIEAKEMLFSRFEIDRLGAGKLAGAVAGEAIDPTRHDLRAQIKACTYHELKLGKEDSHWVAEVIFDV
ncbi:MAG: archease [Actinomycetota bacterium]|nr:archease [Actinomycetota bacterium]